MTGDLYRRDFWQITKRDLAVIGYVLLREWSSIPALWYVGKNLPRLVRKRQIIQSKPRFSTKGLQKWFM